MTRMKTPLQRIRQGATFLGGFSVVAVCGYRYLSGQPWLESIYWYVITISSVGYTEDSRLSASLQAFTIGVILVGIVAAAYTIGGLIQMLTEGEIERAVGARRVTRGIERLRDHVIICGFGRIGQILAEELAHRNVSFVIVDLKPERIVEGQAIGYLTLTGNATDEDSLTAVGIERAKILVAALDSDADNVFLTLTARTLNAKLRIIARGEQHSSEKKLIQAGADRVVLPAVIGAQRIATMVTRPHAADMIDQMISHKILDVDLEEVTLAETSPLAGASVREADLQRRHRVLIVAVRTADGEMIFNPGADFTLTAGQTVIAMGRPDDVTRFRQICQG